MTAHDTSGTRISPTDDSVGWRQADRFSVESVAVTGSDGEPTTRKTPEGVALVSQSCDVVLPDRRNVQVAPVIRLEGNAGREALDGKRSRYVNLPRSGAEWFADLDCVSTVSKLALFGKRAGPGVAGDEEVRRFAAAVARRFGRFAFPDDVSDAMKVLRDLVQSKATKPKSPFGKVLADVVELRAEAREWVTEGSEVTLLFVMVPGALPTLPDDDPGVRPPTLDRFDVDGPTARKRVPQIADALTDEKARWNLYEKFWLWALLAEAAALLCEEQGRSEKLRDYPKFIGEVISADEFPLTRVRRSEIVDLDHLSSPFPDASYPLDVV